MLTLHNERCAWKGFDWATTDRLHQKGLIGDPVNKSKSLVLTDEAYADRKNFSGSYLCIDRYRRRLDLRPFPRQQFVQAGDGRSAMRASTSASQAFGSISLRRAVVIRVSMMAARSAPRSDPAKLQFFRPQATPRRALSAALFVMQILPSSAYLAKSCQRDSM